MLQTRRLFEKRPLLSKVTIILIFCLFAECAAGSCLSYGHACWGAHGKRSGSRTFTMPKESSSLQSDKDLPPNANWILKKLIQNSLSSPQSGVMLPLQQRFTGRIKEIVMPSQLYLNDLRNNPLNGATEWDTSADVVQDENSNDLFHTNSDYNVLKEKPSIMN